MNTINVYAGKELAAYGFPNGHPFSLQRFDAFWQMALKRGFDQRENIIIAEPVVATRKDIALFHTQTYIDKVIEYSKKGVGYLDGGDTPAFPGVYEAAAHVVGTAISATNAIMSQKCRRAFVPIAGLHHAGRDHASGFCVFNDCGVVIELLLQQYNLHRIAYIDIDAHHGDGVFYGFEDNYKVLFADIHEDGHYLFPGTGDRSEMGKGRAKGLKLNIPVPPGADDEKFDTVFDEILRFLKDKQPEFIILQCGADSVAGDPLTHMQYTPKAHQFAAQELVKLAESLGHGRVLSLGGGGYNLENIAKTWCGVVEALADF